MKPLRIVLALDEPPLPFGGAAARWYYVLLRELALRGHRVTAIAPCNNDADADAARSLFPSPQHDLRCHRIAPRSGLLSKFASLRRPFTYVYGPAYRADLNAALAAGFDLFHAEQLWAGWLALNHLDRCVVNIHYLPSIDWSMTCGGPLSQRLLRHNALRAERTLLRRLRHLTTLTPRLTAAVKLVNPHAHVTTVPMALDLSLYPFDEAAPQGTPDLRPPTLSLIGSFNWAPSQGAGLRLITRLWPAILSRVPDARLQIVGRCAKSAFAHLRPPPCTEFHQDVPDILPHFRAADVLLYAPEAGSGIKVKIMEAFALGTPVVTNPEGIEGLPAIDGLHAGIAADDAGLIERTVNLLQRADARQRQRIAARRLLEECGNPDVAINHLLAIYSKLMPPEGCSPAGEPRGNLSLAEIK